MKNIMLKLKDFLLPKEEIKRFVEDEASLVYASKELKTGFVFRN